MKIYKINNAEFVSEELTLGEMEDLLALVGQLKLNIKSSNNSGDEKKRWSDLFSAGDIISGILNAIGEAGSARILSQVLSIILTYKDSSEKAAPEFFLNAKSSVIIGILKDFLAGPGKEIFSGIKNLTTSPLNMQKPSKNPAA